MSGKRYQGVWPPNLHRAMLAAIGQQLKIDYEPPKKLTPELATALKKLDEQPPSTDKPTLEDGTDSVPRHSNTPASVPVKPRSPPGRGFISSDYDSDVFHFVD